MNNPIIIYIVNTVIGIVVGYCLQQAKQHRQENEAIKLGMQAMLRAQIISQYNHAISRNVPSARIYEKENMENCYKQYHALGGNGVVTHLYEEYMELPTK